VLFQALAGVRPKLTEGPVAPGHTDDGHIKMLVTHHRLERWEDLFLGQIAGRAEKDERV
jgi:hypothetical protein